MKTTGSLSLQLIICFCPYFLSAVNLTCHRCGPLEECKTAHPVSVNSTAPCNSDEAACHMDARLHYDTSDIVVTRDCYSGKLPIGCFYVRRSKFNDTREYKQKQCICLYDYCNGENITADTFQRLSSETNFQTNIALAMVLQAILVYKACWFPPFK